MNTTAILAEMISIGAVSLLWLLPLAATFARKPIQLPSLPSGSVEILAATGCLILLLSCFILGWLINGVCYGLTKLCHTKKLRNRFLKANGIELPYDQVRTSVYQLASSSLLTELNNDRTGMRIARSSILNFAMITSVVFLLPVVPTLLFPLPLLFLVFAVVEYWRRTRRYYKEITYGYVNLQKKIPNKRDAGDGKSPRLIRGVRHVIAPCMKGEEQMAQSDTCNECGHVFVDEVPSTDAAQRKPCPKCGSLARSLSLGGEIHATAHVTGSATLITYPQKLLTVCKDLIEDGQHSISVVVAHMACEVSTERALSDAFASKGLQNLEDPVLEFLNGYNLANERNRKLYTALTDDHIKEQSFWQAFTESATRRNRIIHGGLIIGQEEAESSYQAASALVSHLGQ